MSRSAIGMIDLPMLSSPTLRQQLSGHSAITTALKQLAGLNAVQRARYVLIVQDPFTSYYDAKVSADFVQLVENSALNRCYCRSHRTVRRNILMDS